MTVRLARLRRRARVVLWAEALAVAAMAPLGVIVLFLILTLAGAGGWVLDIIGLAGFAVAAWFVRRRFHAPGPDAIDRRIERDSGLAHRPIAAIEDSPAPVPGAQLPLWAAYRARLDRAIADARVGLQAPDFAANDPFALRVLLLLGLIVTWIVAGPQAIPRLAGLLAPPDPFAGPGLEVQGWITPPRWTGAAPRLIGTQEKTVHALDGSSLSLIVTGAGGSAPTASFGGRTLDFEKLDRGSYRATHPLTAPVDITVGPFWHRAARFRIEVESPAPPVIGFTVPPHPDADGRRIDLSWQARSQYGLTSLALRYAPPNAPEAHPENAPIPTGKNRSGSARLDLTASPYAGLAVSGRLVAVSPASLTGQSPAATFTLPRPRLANRTALALEAVRRALALTPSRRADLAKTLTAIGAVPPGPVTPDTGKAIRDFAAAFTANNKQATHPEAQLWTLVQRAEQGAAYRSGQQLAAVRQALEQALARMLAGQPETAQQLAALLDRLNRAAEAHASAMARQTGAQQAGAQKLSMSAIDRLARRIAREAASGETAAAERDMQRLRRMLDRLQSARTMSSAEAAAQQAEQNATRSLSRLLRGEADLMNRTGQPKPGANSSSQSLAEEQQGLRMALQGTLQAMAGAHLPSLPSLEDGARAMTQAGAHLQAGDRAGAMPAERAAITALQHAAGSLEAMQLGHGSEGGPSGLGRAAAGGDGGFGNDNRNTLDLGKADAESKARRIEDDLIRRDAEPGLSPAIHGYYRRLLGSGL